MKEKILAAIKTKFPGVNLSKKRLDAIAAKIEAKVIDDESKIDAELTTYNEYQSLVDLAKEDDRVRNLEAKLKDPKKDETKTEPAKDPEIPADAPEWAKQMLEQNKTLTAAFLAIQGKDHQQTMRTKATEKLKDVPAAFWKNWTLPEKDEDLESFVTNVTTEFQTMVQEANDKGLASFTNPLGGNPGGGEHVKTKEVSPEIKAFVAKQTQAVKPPVTT